MRTGFILLLAAAAGWAQTAQETGKRIVMDSLAALGGDRFLAVTDRVESGQAYSFYRDEVSGLSEAVIYTRYLAEATPNAGPLRLRERQSFTENKKELSAVLFTGDQGYQINYAGARPLSEDVVERYRTTTWRNVFYILRMRLNEPGLVFESRGMDVWMNQPVDVVDIVDASNDVVTVYFHQSTRMPVRQSFYRRNPKTRERIEEVTEYGKFRDVGGGVMWPYTVMRTRDGEKIYQMYADSVTVEKKLSDSLFVLPAGIKILKKL
jgi:hypothetical protein